MNWVNGAWATCLFELKQSFNKQRLSISAILTLFPPVMVFFAVRVGNFPGPPEILLILLVALICALSLLLWATPTVSTEIESKGWTFLASRPQGRISLYLGKYLAAVLFTSWVTTLSILISIAIIPLGDIENPYLTFLKLSGVFFLASVGYAAVFGFIGTLVFKRAMAIAAAYMIIWEGIVAFLPAVVNKITLRFHLQSVALVWLDMFSLDSEMETEYLDIYGSGPNLIYSTPAIFLWTVVFLSLGSFVICFRQYSISDEV